MGQFNVSLLSVLICFLLFEFRLNYCNKKYNLGTSVRSKIKKIETAMINTLQLAARKNLIQMSSNVINYNINCHSRLSRHLYYNSE
jgi:hypothetical protein